MKSAMVAVLLLITLACSTAHSKVPPSVTNSVFVLQANGESICTAFTVVNSKHALRLLTAGHCVASRLDMALTAISPTTRPVSNTPYLLKVIEYKNSWPDDYAILEFVNEYPSSFLDIRTAPEVGDEIWALIAPLGINPFYVPGYFSGVASCSEGGNSCEVGKMYLTTSPVGPGASGSPVMDSRGRVFGIMVGSHPSLKSISVVSLLPKL